MHLEDVPLIMQEKENSCWHSAARMLYGYRKLACIHPLPDTYKADKGLAPEAFLTPESFVDLAKSVGLETVPQVRMCYDWAFLDDLLQHHGPIWAAGTWNGVNHIVVITGVDSNGTLYVNDPAFPIPQIRNMAWFNDRIASDISIPMMYLP